MKPIPISKTPSDSYYIRIRGVAQGPFNEQQLQMLVRRGDLGRIHEISTDQKRWVRAEEYPQLFYSVVPVAFDQPVDHHVERAATAPAAGSAPFPSAPASEAASESWYYYDGAASQGPLDAIALDRMLSSGELTAETLVCLAGATQWVPLKQALGHSEQPPSSRRKRKNSKAWQWLCVPLVFVAVLLISLWLIN